jgi:hypothetical protein
MERSEIRELVDGGGTVPDCAEPVIGRRFAPTRWLYPAYAICNNELRLAPIVNAIYV